MKLSLGKHNLVDYLELYTAEDFQDIYVVMICQLLFHQVMEMHKKKRPNEL